MITNPFVVLLLEDEPLISMDLEQTLETAGFSVSTATSCLEAHAWLDTLVPDVVIVDIELRDGRSTDVVARLVEAKVPFVVHSGDHPAQHGGTPFALGAWLSKPASPDDLVHAVIAATSAQLPPVTTL